MASFTTRTQKVNPATVEGWGVDADPRNDPTYPYRTRSGSEEHGMTWVRPPLQEPRVEVLRSIEHNRLPAVVGTSVPPRGISGVLRRLAFRYSESDWRHWLMLLAADRINVVEGLLEDLSRGRIPNIPAEMDVRAEWKHNKIGLLQKATIVAAVSLAAAAFLRQRSNRDW